MINLRKNRTYLSQISEAEREYIKSEEVENTLSEFFAKSGLSEDQSDLADGEVMQALFGVQTLSQAIENIATITQRGVNDFNQLQSDIEQNIIAKLNEIRKENQSEPRYISEQPQKNSFVGDSFERTILNQTMAMRRVGEAPINLPTSDKAPDFQARPQENTNTAQQDSSQNTPQSSPKNAIHNYIGNSDPYREPLG